MSIKTNHAQESLKPESGVLKVEASGAVALPVGPQEDRPVGSLAGYIRFADDIVKPEYYDGSNWQTITNKEYVDSQVSSTSSSLSDTITNLKLDDLTDVQVLYPTDGQQLTYDSTLGQFRSQTNALVSQTKTFASNGTTLEYDIETIVSSIHNTVVSVNGIQQEPYYSYTLVDGHVIVFDEAPEVGDRIQVKILRSSVTSDRPRPKVVGVSYGTISNFTTITIVATDISYGTGAKIGSTPITRIDYPASDRMQLMVETSRAIGPLWNNPQDLTLIDTSGNEFVFPNMIYCGNAVPYWTDSGNYIGSFSAGDTINFTLGVNNATDVIIEPAYAGETSLPWLSVSGNNIVGTAPQNSTPSRYEVKVTASNGSVYITKNYWLLVI